MADPHPCLGSFEVSFKVAFLILDPQPLDYPMYDTRTETKYNAIESFILTSTK